MPPDLSRLQSVQGQIQSAQSGFQQAAQLAANSQDQNLIQIFAILNDSFNYLMYALNDMCDTLSHADFSSPSQ